MIMKQFTEFKKRISILRLFFNRFYLNKRYRDDAELTLMYCLMCTKEKQEEERLRLSQKYLSGKSH